MPQARPRIAVQYRTYRRCACLVHAGSVSYTHLDVYKRQGHKIGAEDVAAGDIVTVVASKDNSLIRIWTNNEEIEGRLSSVSSEERELSLIHIYSNCYGGGKIGMRTQKTEYAYTWSGALSAERTDTSITLKIPEISGNPQDIKYVITKDNESLETCLLYTSRCV